MSQLIELLRLADSILEAGDPEEQLSKLESYIAAFELFMEHVDSSDPARLVELEEKHSKILTLAESLRDEVNLDIREHYKRGKGIMAYAGSQSKSTSGIKPKKG